MANLFEHVSRSIWLRSDTIWNPCQIVWSVPFFPPKPGHSSREVPDLRPRVSDISIPEGSRWDPVHLRESTSWMAAIVPIKKFRPSNSGHNNGKSFTFFVNFSLLYAVRGSSLRLPRRTPAGSLYTILINNIMKIIVLREIFSTVGPSSSSREPANQRKTTENGPRILCQSSARVTINQTFTQEGVPTPKREPGSADVVTVASKMRKKI